MLRIRFKMGPHQQRNKEWACVFGTMHVHTATILIGLWHLFLNIMALSLLAVIWRNPHMMEELETGYDYTVDMNAPALPTPLSKVDPPYPYRDHSLSYRRQYHNFDMGGLVCSCMIAITLMMIYGTLKGKPSHILPFFCLQLFDFAITTLTAAGYICYLQAIHRLVAESHRLPWREKLLEMSQEELMIVVLVVFILIVFLKAYTIGIVWRCYKYLTLRQQNLRTLLPCVMPELGGAAGGLVGEERAYSTLLPNYDEAIAQYMKQAPPPSYQVAMSNYQRVNAELDNAANNANGDVADDNANGGVAANIANGGVAGNVAGNAGVVAAASAPAADSVVILPGAAVVTVADAMDNNNDVSNNNNTVHVNANTPPMRRNELLAARGNARENVVAAAIVGAAETAAIEGNEVTVNGATAPAAAASIPTAPSGSLTPPPPYIDGNGRVIIGIGEQQQQARNSHESQA